jgi:hypothetical protein
MTRRRKIEIFSAGCTVCQKTVDLVRSLACPSCEVAVLDMQDPQVALRAETLGLQSVPAVLVNGRLADCCAGSGPDEASLRRAGIGQPIP